ncbi:MAG: PilZ domain-containing protein [Deltaproteobacteria bacterium]|nr:PilZ domain-containing protein [Deltaproteobacteria bacterium]
MKESEKKAAKNRSEPRMVPDQYTSVEFSISKQDPIFQFRVRDVSPSGMGILVNDGSMALKFLKVGQVLNMKYNPADPYDSPEQMETEIRHITLLDTGRYRGHHLVGLLIKKGSEVTRKKD